MNRQTKRVMRLSAHGASAVIVASTIAAIQATSCVYSTPSPNCEDLHEACSSGASGGRPTDLPDKPDAGPPDKPDAGPSDKPDAGLPDGESPDGEPPMKTCVPRDSSTVAVDETCGVFVAASRAGSEGKGTKEEPFGSLQQAIEAALHSETNRVYACAGEGEQFNETIEVVGGVTLYGGLDCKNGWIWIGDTTKTRLTAGEGQIPLTMRGASGTVRIEDVHVVAPSATAQQIEDRTGVSSIAAVAHGADVALVRCVLEAGNAAPGAHGTPHMGRAAAGGPGLKGGDGCSRDDDQPVPGGDAVVNSCGTPDDPTDDSIGGRGGDGLIRTGGAGADGQPLGTANGGTGWSTDDTCKPGNSGNSGSRGMPGAGAMGKGAISSAGYIGKAGEPGGRGAPGQGGGGGGGDRGDSSAQQSQYRCSNDARAVRAGAGGGSGGAGGCGGLGGRGGSPGGASIALLSVEATFSFDHVTLMAGKGGDGGNGGNGQPGGEGGDGGPGGSVPTTAQEIFGACKGGPGGSGGDGGKGGGGQGGHSLGIAFRGTPPPTDGVTIHVGDTGLGGNPDGDPTGKGSDGIASDMLEFE